MPARGRSFGRVVELGCQGSVLRTERIAKSAVVKLRRFAGLLADIRIPRVHGFQRPWARECRKLRISLCAASQCPPRTPGNSWAAGGLPRSSCKDSVRIHSTYVPRRYGSWLYHHVDAHETHAAGRAYPSGTKHGHPWCHPVRTRLTQVPAHGGSTHTWSTHTWSTHTMVLSKWPHIDMHAITYTIVRIHTHMGSAIGLSIDPSIHSGIHVSIHTSIYTTCLRPSLSPGSPISNTEIRG